MTLQYVQCVEIKLLHAPSMQTWMCKGERWKTLEAEENDEQTYLQV